MVSVKIPFLSNRFGFPLTEIILAMLFINDKQSERYPTGACCALQVGFEIRRVNSEYTSIEILLVSRYY